MEEGASGCRDGTGRLTGAAVCKEDEPSRGPMCRLRLLKPGAAQLLCLQGGQVLQVRFWCRSRLWAMGRREGLQAMPGRCKGAKQGRWLDLVEAQNSLRLAAGCLVCHPRAAHVTSVPTPFPGRCSKECHIRHWPVHKPQCRAARAAAAAAAAQQQQAQRAQEGDVDKESNAD